ncbi:hypothetical protein ACRAWD_00725 [Caulobacter segnis]
MQSYAGAEVLGPSLKTRTIDLQVSVADQAARYAYSLDGGKTFVDLGAAAPLRFSWWKGARPGAVHLWRPGPDEAGSRRFRLGEGHAVT